LLDALGAFDLDPCAAPMPRPWATAARHIALPDDGLKAVWTGRVWLNPPFDRRVVGAWLRRLADHGDGVALLHARTETGWFGEAWRSASAMNFLARRVTFCGPDGAPHAANSGAPVVLLAYGMHNVEALRSASLPGQLVTSWESVAA
jgi:hypothetical protein